MTVSSIRTGVGTSVYAAAAGGVTTVAGRTGAVVLTVADVAGTLQTPASLPAGTNATLSSSPKLTNITGTGTTTFTLPTMANVTTASGLGALYIIKDSVGIAGTSNQTITASGGALIDGAASVVMSTNYQAISLIPNGTNWSRV